MKLPIALQLYSVRDFMEKDFEGTIQKVKEMGYEGVEFAGLFGRTGDEVKSICEKVGIKIVSAHVPYDELISNPGKTLFDYKTMGCKYIAVPYLSEERRPGTEGFSDTINGIRLIGEEALKMGIKLLYHNHDFEFKKIQGKYALDILYDTVSKEILETELDTCWVNVGGEDPVKYIEKYSGRAPLVHLKDFVGRIEGRPVYSLIGIEDREEKETNSFQYRPIGYGIQNIKAIVNASERAGAKWLIVEQDEPSMNKTSMECAKMSIDYLKNL